MVITAQLLLASTLMAAPPTGDQAKSVFDHFYKGQGQGIVLSDAVLCQTIERSKKETKNDCTEEFSTASKGDKVNVYMTFLIPKGDSKDLMIQSVHEGVVRQTRDFTVEGKWIRTRTWKSFTLKKKGKWEFKILDGANVLKTLSIDAS